jgi:hypothetical protein
MLNDNPIQSVVPPRRVSREMIDTFPPLEKLIAESYIMSGRWVLDTSGKA